LFFDRNVAKNDIHIGGYCRLEFASGCDTYQGDTAKIIRFGASRTIFDHVFFSTWLLSAILDFQRNEILPFNISGT